LRTLPSPTQLLHKGKPAIALYRSGLTFLTSNRGCVDLSGAACGKANSHRCFQQRHLGPRAHEVQICSAQHHFVGAGKHGLRQFEAESLGGLPAVVTEHAQPGHDVSGDCCAAGLRPAPKSALGQNPLLPHCNIDGRFSSVNRHALRRPRALPAGFIAPCLPTKAPHPPSGGQGCTRSSMTASGSSPARTANE
jgi:hypothetical protein